MAQSILDAYLEAARLRIERELLRRLLRLGLERRFGPLPREVIADIESADDLDLLDKAVLSAHALASLDDLDV